MNMAGQAGQAAMGAGRGAMNMASQLPGQIQGAYQGVKHGSQGGANRGGAYLPGIGGRVGNFAHGLKQGGISGLMEQGLVGTARAGQQDKYGIGVQESKDMRRLHDSNMKDAGVAAARGNLSEGQQAAYGWNPEGQPAPAPGAPAGAGAGAAAPTPGDADGNGVLDVEETQKTSTDGATGEVTQTNETKVTPQAADPASGNSTGDPQPAQGGGGGVAGNLLGAATKLGLGVAPGGVLDNPNGGSGSSDASGGTSAFAQAAAGGGGGGSSNSNSSGNVMNVYGMPGGGAGGAGAGGAGAGGAGAGSSKVNPAQQQMIDNAQERSQTSGGFGTGVLSNLATGGLSGLMRGGYNAYQRGKGREQLRSYAGGDYTKAEELASTLAIRQDIEKGRLGDALNALRGKNMSDEEMESNRARKRFEAIQQIERGKAFRAGHKPLTREQYEKEADRMGAMHERGGDRIAPFYAPTPEAPSEEEAAPEEEAAINRNDIVERSEPWTVVENPFDNPFYSENAFTLRKEPAPQAEVEHSIIDDYIAKDLTPESEIEVSGFDTVEGDDLSLLPASVFAKSNPVGDDMSLLPSGWNADVE
tara:strand:- start:67 stop:1824 length:1758 start_codon:yes stop_codon:yes gene_type:complete